MCVPVRLTGGALGFADRFESAGAAQVAHQFGEARLEIVRRIRRHGGWRVGIVAPSLGARFLWSGFVRELFRAGQFFRELTETGDVRHLIAVGHVADVIEVGNPRDLIVADVGDPIGVEKIRRRGRALTLSVCDFAPQIGSW